MEFALTRKQLNKKREKEQALTGQPAPAAPGMSPPPAGGGGPGVDPVTGLPAGYDPLAPAAPAGAGSDFFTSNAGVLGRQPGSTLSPPPDGPGFAPAPPPSPGFGSFAPSPTVGPPVPPTFATPAPPSLLEPARPVTPSTVPPPPAPLATGLIEGDRPKGADLARVLVRRYAGFVLFVVIAILLMAFLPSLRHSPSSPSGLGPVRTVTPAFATPAPTAGWTSGPGVRSVSTSYA